jgi:hypothetical protein
MSLKSSCGSQVILHVPALSFFPPSFQHILFPPLPPPPLFLSYVSLKCCFLPHLSPYNYSVSIMASWHLAKRIKIFVAFCPILCIMESEFYIAN